MFFNTWQFAGFAVLVVLLYRFTRPDWRAYVLIVAGLVFYANAGIKYLVLLLAATGFTYATARMLQAYKESGKRRAILSLAIFLLVSTLSYFKYAHWMTKSLSTVFPAAHTFGPLIVPLAISFFTFEFIHFISDVYTGRIQRFTLKHFLTFALFFPTMVAGPIKRFRLFSTQLDNPQMADGAEFHAALYRIVVGVFKKLAIADPVTTFVQPLFHPLPGTPPHVYAVAMIAGTIKIYYDLSGYSDIAIGFSRLFGLRVPENFARPYYAPNIQEFWHRWHISLSSWVRDYIFVPLARSGRAGAPAASRRGRLVTMACFVVTMFVIGMWHGAGWQFAAWGLWNGLSLVIYYGWRHGVVPYVGALQQGSSALQVASIGLTYASFAFGLGFIAAPSASEAFIIYRSFF